MLDVSKLTIVEAGRAFRSSEFTPLELTQVYLDRIAEFDSELNSFITVTPESALAAARAATDELSRGVDRGPLHGIPIAYKDLIATAGVRCSSGSRILSDRIPDHDATVVQFLRKSGAVSLGKLNMLEFAYGVVHPDYGPALNPWNIDYSSGGSSSGSGVAVAAGLCLGALGTDTGGSIRIPAAWCGVVGLKPTYGLVSRAGVDPLAWSLDHVGPMTRTAIDAALLLEGMAGFDPHDPASVPGVAFRAIDVEAVNLSNLRVAVPREWLETGIDDVTKQRFESTLEQLAKTGAQIERVSIDLIDDLLAAEMTIMFSEAAAVHQPWLRAHAKDYSPLTLDRLVTGSAIPAVHYINAQRARRMLIEKFKKIHEQFDLLVTPASPTGAIRNDATMLHIGMEEVDIFRGLVRITGPFNLTGAPAISVPCGMAGDGLPMAIQFVGRAFEDHVVLAAAAGLEDAMSLRPELPVITRNRRDSQLGGV